ncbi:MAG: response regulator [Alphaproteobacteria bacterium]|nr:MAG: response regulator [Alphaproteobacteria bacterium]
MARILVAEDEPSVRAFITRCLDRAGYQVTTACDGQQALTLLTRNTYDLLLTDIVMPEMDGIALALRVARDWPDLRVVMISGYPQERMRAHNLNVLVHRIVAKPFSMQELLDAVADSLKTGPAAQ